MLLHGYDQVEYFWLEYDGWCFVFSRTSRLEGRNVRFPTGDVNSDEFMKVLSDDSTIFILSIYIVHGALSLQPISYFWGKYHFRTSK